MPSAQRNQKRIAATPGSPPARQRLADSRIPCKTPGSSSSCLLKTPASPPQITAQYYGYFVPVDKRERLLVDIMIHAERLRRHFLSLKARARDEEIAGTLSRSTPQTLKTTSGLEAADSAQRTARQILEVIRKRTA